MGLAKYRTKESGRKLYSKTLQDPKRMRPDIAKTREKLVLIFSYEEEVKIEEKDVSRQTILGVDLGRNNDCVCCVMKSDGTVIGRKFLNLSREKDSLTHALNRIKKAQQHGALRTPRLWGRAKGINTNIANLTARFIVDIAILCKVDIVF